MRSLEDIAALESEPLETRIGTRTACDWLNAGSALDPARTAISYLADADPDSVPFTLSHGELQARAVQAANLFHALGVRRDRAVVLIMPTLPQWYAATLGALAAGSVCSVNWMLQASQWLDIVRASRARVIVALGPTDGFDIWERLQAVREALPPDVMIVPVHLPGQARAEDFDHQIALQGAQPLGLDDAPVQENIATWVHSGGTTGAPKLVAISHRNLVYKLWANALIEARSPTDTVFADYPMFHVAGFLGRGLLPVATGAGVLIASPIGARDPRFIANYWKLIERYRVSFLSGVPTTLSVLVNHPPQGQDLSSLRAFMTTGSTALSPDIARRIEAMTGVRVLLTYGATEYTMNVTQAPREGEVRYGSAGIRIPYTEVQAVTLDGDGIITGTCAPDQIGTIAIRGPGLAAGLVRSGALTADGWFVSGDLGRVDAQGYLWITGRSRDLIIRGGHNIDPRLIEDALRRHPAVVHAAAVGKPDAHAGELPVAYVELLPGAQVDTDALLTFAREAIPERAAIPREIHVLPQMALTDVGKPDKVRLRSMAMRDAFSAVVRDIVGEALRVDVDVRADPAHGVQVQIEIKAGERRTNLEPRIDETLARFPISTKVRWR